MSTDIDHDRMMQGIDDDDAHTTKQPEWKEYTGSDEQIDLMLKAPNGFIIKATDHKDQSIIKHMELLFNVRDFLSTVTHYWIIPADPLREMKIRQAMTGQPVWWRFSGTSFEPGVRCTTSPDWNIPSAEYSFAPFED